MSKSIAYEMYERYYKGYSNFFDVFDARYEAKSICIMICNENINNTTDEFSINLWNNVLKELLNL